MKNQHGGGDEKCKEVELKTHVHSPASEVTKEAISNQEWKHLYEISAAKVRELTAQTKPNWRPIAECYLKDDEWLIAGRFVNGEWNTSKATQRQHIPLNVWTHFYQIPPPPEPEKVEQMTWREWWNIDERVKHMFPDVSQEVSGAIHRLVEAIKQGKVKL